MPPANMETDPFFTLLTDALRAGPASPQWHEAIASLRQQGLEGADEHRLLIEARENLESGRDYRAVRAGPGFTRKLMSEIEKEPAGGRRNGIPTATLIAIICGFLIAGGALLIGMKFWPHEVSTQQQIDELSGKSSHFLDSLGPWSFSGSIPDQWKPIGALKLDLANGLRPDPQAAAENKGLGGGVVWNNTIPAEKAFAVEVSVRVPDPTAAILLEVFVSTKNNFSEDKGTSSPDLVWQLRGLQQQVLVSGNGKILTTAPPFHDGDKVRLVVDQNVAIVEAVSGDKTQRLWAGKHDLGSGARFVGVRFLQTGAAGKHDLSVQQIKMTTSAPG